MDLADDPLPEHADPVAPDPRWSWSSLLVLSGLWAFAVTQPLLAVLGDEPGFFLVRRASDRAIVAFAVLLAVAPPLLLWLVGRVIGRVDGGSARWYQRLVLAGIVAAAMAPMLVDLGITNGALDAALALAAGAGFALAYERFDPVALWARFTVVLPVLSVGAFLLASPTSAILQTSTVAASGGPDGTVRPSVLFLVLDELPTKSLLDADGGIDRVRFPSLAALADDGTWYRNHTAAATTTAQAIPSILTGNGPRDGAPLAATYPENLFSLLAPTHRLQVSESLTAMCPSRLCQASDRNPAFVNQVGGLTADSATVLLDRIRPDRSPQPTMDDFAETLESLGSEQIFGELVSAPTRFTEFVDELGGPGTTPGAEVEPIAFETPTTDVTAAPDEPAADPAPGTDQADPTIPADPTARLEPNDDATARPTLSYLHLLLPHGPWRLYPDGQPYATTSYPVGGYDDSSDEPWIKALAQQRHLLQASYADHLVGELMATLKRAGTYDDTLIVTIADHGVAFRHGSDARLWDDATASDIAYSPLIIKAPGQVEGGPDDRNVTSLDVVPTIADLLGVPVPWSTEGDPIDSQAVRDRGDAKRIVDRGSWATAAERNVHEFAMSETTPAAASRLIPPSRTTSVAISDEPFGAPGVLDGLLEPLQVGPWLGRSLDEIAGDAPNGISATLVAPEPAAEPEGLVRGVTVEAADGAVVLVAVDGTVVTAAPLIELDGQPGTFVALLPPDALLRAADRTTVELALVTGPGTEDAVVERLPIET